MRAVGATRRQVRRTILAESLLLTAAGTAFGILAGLWLGYMLVGALIPARHAARLNVVTGLAYE